MHAQVIKHTKFTSFPPSSPLCSAGNYNLACDHPSWSCSDLALFDKHAPPPLSLRQILTHGGLAGAAAVRLVANGERHRPVHASRHARARALTPPALTPPAARPTDGHFSYRAHARREGGRPRLVLLALLLGPADFGRRRLRMQADMRARVHLPRRRLPRRRPDPRTDILVIARMQGGREGGRASSCLRFSSARRTSAAAACACKPTCARACTYPAGAYPAGGPTHGRTF